MKRLERIKRLMIEMGYNAYVDMKGNLFVRLKGITDYREVQEDFEMAVELADVAEEREAFQTVEV
jgi:hypothetical protein